MKQSLCLDDDGRTIETSDSISFNFPTEVFQHTSYYEKTNKQKKIAESTLFKIYDWFSKKPFNWLLPGHSVRLQQTIRIRQ